ncbi:MAG: hypothetical protein WKG07_18575 [Hymenobacter sp.]
MFIVLMPFSSGVFSSYGVVGAAFTIYAINIMLAGLAQVLLLRYLLNPAHRLILPEDRTHPDLDTWRPLVAVVGFGAALVAVLLLPSHGLLSLLIPFTPCSRCPSYGCTSGGTLACTAPTWPCKSPLSRCLRQRRSQPRNRCWPRSRPTPSITKAPAPVWHGGFCVNAGRGRPRTLLR